MSRRHSMGRGGMSMKLKRLAAAAVLTVVVTAAACPALAECPKRCTATPKPRVTCAQKEADRREAAYLASVRAYQKAIAAREQAYLDSVKAYQKAVAQREQAYLNSLYHCP